ncbi:MAG TPA: hypothetical protein VJU86_04555 [Pyrinomonadaceae bacterium]|nr:hypothetical protein [Pyrinomonadaceae bacterium]
MSRLILVLSVALMLTATVVYGQEPLGAGPKKARTPADYTSRTLKEIASASEGEAGDRDGKGGVIYGNVLPSRVRLTFRGSVRSLPEDRKALLRRWTQRYAGAPEFYMANYQSEMLFNETGTNHWLTIGKQLIKQIQNDLNRGDKVDLFLIRLGSVNGPSEREGLLLVESFQKVK